MAPQPSPTEPLSWDKQFISVFINRNHESPEPYVVTTVGEVLESLSSGSILAVPGSPPIDTSLLAERLKSPDKNVSEPAKHKLPAALFSGVKAGHKDSDPWLSQSGLIVADFDGLSSPAALSMVMEALWSSPMILAIWVSPRGKGLKALVAVDGWGSPAEAAKIAGQLLVEHCRQVSGLAPTLDENACKQTQLTFLALTMEMRCRPSDHAYRVVNPGDEDVLVLQSKANRVLSVNRVQTKLATGETTDRSAKPLVLGYLPVDCPSLVLLGMDVFQRVVTKLNWHFADRHVQLREVNGKKVVAAGGREPVLHSIACVLSNMFVDPELIVKVLVAVAEDCFDHTDPDSFWRDVDKEVYKIRSGVIAPIVAPARATLSETVAEIEHHEGQHPTATTIETSHEGRITTVTSPVLIPFEKNTSSVVYAKCVLRHHLLLRHNDRDHLRYIITPKGEFKLTNRMTWERCEKSGKTTELDHEVANALSPEIDRGVVRNVIESVRVDVSLFGRAVLSPPFIMSAALANRDELAPAPVAVSCRNGYITSDGVFHENDPDRFDPYVLATSYDPEAKCPLWTELISSMLNEEPTCIRQLQDYLGTCLNPSVVAEKLLLLAGPAGAGKGTVYAVLAAVVGSRLANSPITFSKAGGDFAKTRFCGRLVTNYDEPNNADDMRAMGDEIKSLVGNATTSTNVKNGEYADQQVTVKLILTTNSLPLFPDVSEAWLRRLIALRVSPPLVRIERLKQDIIDNELPGVLRWMIEGWLRTQARALIGEDTFVECPVSSAFLHEIRTESTPVLGWIEDCCELHPDAAVLAEHALGSFREWHHEHKGGQCNMSQDALCGQLRLKGLECRRPASVDGSARKRVIYGMRLNSQGGVL